MDMGHIIGQGWCFIVLGCTVIEVLERIEGTRPNGGNGSDARMFVMQTFID
jgi:hypothetical protein